MQREGKPPQQGTGSREEEDKCPPPPKPPASSAYSGEFYLYSFKIVPCTASYAHNWSLCPFVHPNEKARRRDPRLYSYQPLPCPFDKKGANCPHGDNCSYTHNVYEYWLHPKRFRTQMCQQGAACKRPLCFFAHNLQELRCPDGQLQRGNMPPPQDASAALEAQAASMQDMQQQQQAAAAVAAGMGAGQYVPFAVMPSAAGPGASRPPLQPGFVPSPVAGAPSPQARMMVGQQMVGQQMMQQQQQQQGWVHPGYMVPQGYAMLGGAQGQLYPFMQVGGADQGQQQQQQQYVPTVRSQWQFGGGSPGLQLPGGPSAAAAAAVAAAVCAPMGGGAGGFQASLQHPDPALMGSQYQMVPSDNQVLLGQPAGAAGGDSSSGYLAAQQQQQQAQQAQQDAAAAAAAASVMSGSQFSWNLKPAAGPSTTSASASMSVLSMPTVGLSSTASVPGSSNNSLSHLRPGQAGTVPLDVLQAMKHMSVRDCHVRDL